jgi:hypothetical protein
MSNADNDSYIPMKPQLKKKKNKKRDTSTLRKAPQAPKRFKSSYICFFTAKQAEFKKELGDTSTIAEISKLSGQKWKALPADVRNYWDDVAAQDKLRYDIEKASYTGPWQVPSKRAKKDPSAPKRSMSAFLFFSQGRRSQIKAKNPEMKNTEISKMLGNLWRNCPDDDRRPYVEKEKIERDKYKIAMAKWKSSRKRKRNESNSNIINNYHRYYQHLSNVNNNNSTFNSRLPMVWRVELLMDTLLIMRRINNRCNIIIHKQHHTCNFLPHQD